MLWAKIKNAVIGLLLLALPILYAIGILFGRKTASAERSADAARAANDTADFYKRMAEHEGNLDIHSRSDLIERLRKDGL